MRRIQLNTTSKVAASLVAGLTLVGASACSSTEGEVVAAAQDVPVTVQEPVIEADRPTSTIVEDGIVIQTREPEPINDESIYFTEGHRIPVANAADLSQRGYVKSEDTMVRPSEPVFDIVPVYDEKTDAHIAYWKNGAGWAEKSAVE